MINLIGGLSFVHVREVQGASAKRNEAYFNTANEHRKLVTQQYTTSNYRVGSSADKQVIKVQGAKK